MLMEQREPYRIIEEQHPHPGIRRFGNYIAPVSKRAVASFAVTELFRDHGDGVVEPQLINDLDVELKVIPGNDGKMHE